MTCVFQILLNFLFLTSYLVIFFCKQKTAYEMRISDWSSYVCASDLNGLPLECVRKIADRLGEREDFGALVLICEGRGARSANQARGREIGRASCRERVCQYV